jgi:uncharacterized protein with HEPN domain
MTKRDYRIYIKDILKNMETAEGFLKGMLFEDFAKDRKTSYAVVRCIEIIGEATKHIPNLIRKRYPKIPWKRMAGMRDKVIHEYFGVAIEVVWKTVKEEIPKIKPLVKKVLAELTEMKK